MLLMALRLFAVLIVSTVLMVFAVLIALMIFKVLTPSKNDINSADSFNDIDSVDVFVSADDINSFESFCCTWIAEWYHTWLLSLEYCAMPWAMSYGKLFFGPQHNIYALFMILFGLFDLILLFVCQICHVNWERENWK